MLSLKSRKAYIFVGRQELLKNIDLYYQAVFFHCRMKISCPELQNSNAVLMLFDRDNTC